MTLALARVTRRAAGVSATLLALTAIATEPAAAAGSEIEAQLESRGRADLVQPWREAAAVERRANALERDDPAAAVELYLEAARRFEAIAREQTGLAAPWWRSAHSTWSAGDTLPVEAGPQRIEHFEAAKALCERGLEVDPECAECMLWKFSSMGRLGTARGVWASLRQLPEMAELLDRAIALESTHTDARASSTLANLHYSSAIFYRVLPDGFWMEWMAGVRGDKDRALAHIRTARSIHPNRLDYQVELGSQLLCLGSARDSSEQLAEGRKVMRTALLREPDTLDDVRDIAAARIMLDAPSKACRYSGDTWVEIDRGEARRPAKQAGLAP